CCRRCRRRVSAAAFFLIHATARGTCDAAARSMAVRPLNQYTDEASRSTPRRGRPVAAHGAWWRPMLMIIFIIISTPSWSRPPTGLDGRCLHPAQAGEAIYFAPGRCPLTLRSFRLAPAAATLLAARPLVSIAAGEQPAAAG